MQVFGAAWDYGKLCMDPLSDPLSLLYVPCDTSVSGKGLANLTDKFVDTKPLPLTLMVLPVKFFSLLYDLDM